MNESERVPYAMDYREGYKRANANFEECIEKIRAEIDLETRIQVKHYTNTDAVIDAVLDVIDEYKAEELHEKHKQERITERFERGADGNVYKLTISNGKEFEQISAVLLRPQ